MTQTLRRERIQKFSAILLRLFSENGIFAHTSDEYKEYKAKEFAEQLADAAESRSEKKTDETKGEYQAGDRKPDLVDLELSKLPAMSIRKAISEYFKLNTNWDTKYNRQWMEWAVETGITAEQISRAADTWRTDKQFNWQVPTLKGIFEKWQMLMESSEKDETPLRML